MKIKSMIISGLGMLSFVTAVHAAEVVSGCQEADYVLVDKTKATVGISDGYTPRCLKVKVGTAVSIEASRRHPLMAQRDIAGVANPFAADGESESTLTHTLSKPGYYGYFCTNHGDESGSGMAGSIQVVQ